MISLTVWNIYNRKCPLIDAHGALFWIKSTLYQYLTKKYGEISAPADLKLPGTPVSEKEMELPDASKLPDDEPVKRYGGKSRHFV